MGDIPPCFESTSLTAEETNSCSLWQCICQKDKQRELQQVPESLELGKARVSLALHLLPLETLPIEMVKDRDARGGGLAKQKNWEGREKGF